MNGDILSNAFKNNSLSRFFFRSLSIVVGSIPFNAIHKKKKQFTIFAFTPRGTEPLDGFCTHTHNMQFNWSDYQRFHLNMRRILFFLFPIFSHPLFLRTLTSITIEKTNFPFDWNQFFVNFFF